jgi:hypothetical protein
MKLIYRHPITGQRIVKRFARWPDLLDEAWRIYFRELTWSARLDRVCEAGCDALVEVLPLSTLNS